MNDEPEDEDEGGESACFAHLICPECGVVLEDAKHVQGCGWASPEIDLNVIDELDPRARDSR
jgi:hypothetical protein